ncbi:MAG: hypothetical protein LAT82_04495 [Nanoarchaeota archaeon]|nr:hypothetical protein [Nanoarchaeota archaeon]
MKCSATLRYQTQNPQELYELLISEDYDFKDKEVIIEISIKISKNDENKNTSEEEVVVEIQAATPHLLKVVTTAVNDSCEVIRKTQELIQNNLN